MAEWRAIYASLAHDARVKGLSVKARYVYVFTIVNANDQGSLPWDELQVAKWADVSAPVARAAMVQLEASGLLTIANGRASHDHWDRYQGPAGNSARRARTRAHAQADPRPTTDHQPTDLPTGDLAGAAAIGAEAIAADERARLTAAPARTANAGAYSPAMPTTLWWRRSFPASDPYQGAL